LTPIKVLSISDVVSTQFHFAEMTDEEIEGYVAAGEPLNVAGGFTLDGMSAPLHCWHRGRKHQTLIGLSLPLLRKTL
jgi:septum formation protein